MGTEKKPGGSGGGAGGGAAPVGPEQRGKKGGGGTSSSGEAPTCCGCRFPLLVALLQLLLGVAIAAVAFLMLAISPSLLARETPYWAGIILCVVALLGFVLYCITYLPDEKTSLQFIAKLLYFLLCSLGLIVSVLAVAFQSFHYNQASGFTCKAAGQDCVCRLDQDDPLARTFTYAAVEDCSAVTGTLPLYYLLQVLLNLGQALVCLLAAFIMWKHRYQVFFSGMQRRSLSSQQWQKV